MFGKKNERVDLMAFTIHDTKSGTYREPMMSINEFDMVRQIETLFSDPNQRTNILVSHPRDFALYQIGTFDRRTGVFEPIQHRHIIDLKDVESSLVRQSGAIPGASLTGISPKLDPC